MNKIIPILLALSILSVSGCKSGKKKEEEKKSFISALSIIRGQVNHIDTSFYSITRISYHDSLHSDTQYIRREEVRSLAADFLSIPDLADHQLKKIYTEKSLFDESLNLFIITYTPLDPEHAPIQKEEILVTPSDFGGESKIKSIIIEREFVSRDSAMQKKMLWQIDQGFQVTTILQKNSRPETISTIKVSWQ